MASTADRAGRVVADPDPFHRAMTGPPEVTFGVADLALDDGAVTATMKLDARHTYRDQVAMGALGVLVDDALGFAILANRPDGFWSVSTEMRIDMLRPLPAVGAAVRVRASSIASSRSGGAATGEVLAPDGGVIAVGVQRSKFIEGTPGDLPPPVATGSAVVSIQRYTRPSTAGILTTLGTEWGRTPRELECRKATCGTRRRCTGALTWRSGSNCGSMESSPPRIP